MHFNFGFLWFIYLDVKSKWVELNVSLKKNSQIWTIFEILYKEYNATSNYSFTKVKTQINLRTVRCGFNLC